MRELSLDDVMPLALALCHDGTTVTLWCGGDDAHCDADGTCWHLRQLVAAQDDVPGRTIELRPRQGVKAT